MAGMVRSSRAHRKNVTARPRWIRQRHCSQAAGDFAPSGAHAPEVSSAPAARTHTPSASVRSRCAASFSSSTSTSVRPVRST